MPELTRPAGARIDYEDRGAGPPVVLVLSFFTLPAVYEEYSRESAATEAA